MKRNAWLAAALLSTLVLSGCGPSRTGVSRQEAGAAVNEFHEREDERRELSQRMKDSEKRRADAEQAQKLAKDWQIPPEPLIPEAVAKESVLRGDLLRARVLWLSGGSTLDGRTGELELLRIATMALRDTNLSSDTRLLAVRFLDEMGPKAKPAGEALRLAAKDRDQEVRQAAAKALQAIGPATAEKLPHEASNAPPSFAPAPPFGPLSRMD